MEEEEENSKDSISESTRIYLLTTIPMMGSTIERQEVNLLYFTVSVEWPKDLCGDEWRTSNEEIQRTDRNIWDYFYVYTDGSGIGGEIGAAVTLPMINYTRKAYMGDSTTSTVYAAELQGIRLALKIALDDWNKGSRRKKLIIYTDNQAAIEQSDDRPADPEPTLLPT